MSSKQTKPHNPFHIVKPSPWPIVGSISALVLAIGGVLFMHDINGWIVWIGLALLIFTLVGWWHDVIKESMTSAHTPEVKRGFRYGMALFIASEMMFFAAFFWAYFDSSLFPATATGGVWPPKGIEIVDPFDLPYLNTIILLLSASLVTWAHFDIIEGNLRGMIIKTGFSIVLAIVFMFVQAFEFAHATFKFTGGIYPSTFYMAVGFHGFHVFVGTIFLAVCWVRAQRGDYTPTDHFGFEAAAWYWHFVDVVWLFLFVSVYWLGSIGY